MEHLVVTQAAQNITVAFASTLVHVDAAVRVLIAFAQQQIPCGLFDLELVLREALTNAVQHGNQLDSTRQVQCAMQAGQEILRITVVYRGQTLPSPA